MDSLQKLRGAVGPNAKPRAKRILVSLMLGVTALVAGLATNEAIQVTVNAVAPPERHRGAHMATQWVATLLVLGLAVGIFLMAGVMPRTDLVAV